jgi:hypothetical protein
MSVVEIVLLASLSIPALAAVFWHARAFSLYRLLGVRAGDLGYFWFAFEIANPDWTRKYPGHADLFSSLPEDLATQVLPFRRDIRRAKMVITIYGMVFIVALIGLGVRR